jgi:hypothetical protein
LEFYGRGAGDGLPAAPRLVLVLAWISSVTVASEFATLREAGGELGLSLQPLLRIVFAIQKRRKFASSPCVR